MICTVKKMMIELIKENENYYVGFDCNSIFSNEWDNADSMRLATLAQAIILEYDVEAMEELDNLMEIMQIRFQALQKEFSWRLH